MDLPFFENPELARGVLESEKKTIEPNYFLWRSVFPSIVSCSSDPHERFQSNRNLFPRLPKNTIYCGRKNGQLLFSSYFQFPLSVEEADGFSCFPQTSSETMALLRVSFISRTFFACSTSQLLGCDERTGNSLHR